MTRKYRFCMHGATCTDAEECQEEGQRPVRRIRGHAVLLEEAIQLMGTRKPDKYMHATKLGDVFCPCFQVSSFSELFRTFPMADSESEGLLNVHCSSREVELGNSSEMFRERGRLKIRTENMSQKRTKQATHNNTQQQQQQRTNPLP